MGRILRVVMLKGDGVVDGQMDRRERSDVGCDERKKKIALCMLLG